MLVSSVTNWLVGANKLLKTWSDRISVPDVSQECVQNHLIKLLVKLFPPVYSEVLKKTNLSSSRQVKQSRYPAVDVKNQ